MPAARRSFYSLQVPIPSISQRVRPVTVSLKGEDPFFNPSIYRDARNIVVQKQRRQLGHKFEFIIGKHRRRKVNPPKVPVHPTKDIDKDMNYFETYRDLKLRWKRTTKSRKNRVVIARKWRQPRYINPASPPTCTFIMHDRLPQTRKTRGYGRVPPKEGNREYVPGEIVLDESHNFDVYPPPEVVNRLRKPGEDIFCVFKSSAIHQHKVTKGDLVQIERLKRRSAGDKVTFGTVLLVGSKDWTIIGKPTVPYAKVHATIEQQTLCGEQLSFRYRKSRRISRFLRVRHWVTILKIDEIEIDPEMKIATSPVKPLRLLDLWANRWLYEEEKEGVKYDGNMTVAEAIYDGTEHKAGSYNRLGLTEAYRYSPDPYAKD